MSSIKVLVGIVVCIACIILGFAASMLNTEITDHLYPILYGSSIAPTPGSTEDFSSDHIRWMSVLQAAPWLCAVIGIVFLILCIIWPERRDDYYK